MGILKNDFFDKNTKQSRVSWYIFREILIISKILFHLFMGF